MVLASIEENMVSFNNFNIISFPVNMKNPPSERIILYSMKSKWIKGTDCLMLWTASTYCQTIASACLDCVQTSLKHSTIGWDYTSTAKVLIGLNSVQILDLSYPLILASSVLTEPISNCQHNCSKCSPHKSVWMNLFKMIKIVPKLPATWLETQKGFSPSF